MFGGRAAGFTPLQSVSRVSGLGSKVGAAPAKKPLGTLSGRPEVSLGFSPAALFLFARSVAGLLMRPLRGPHDYTMVKGASGEARSSQSYWPTWPGTYVMHLHDSHRLRGRLSRRRHVGVNPSAIMTQPIVWIRGRQSSYHGALHPFSGKAQVHAAPRHILPSDFQVLEVLTLQEYRSTLPPVPPSVAPIFQSLCFPCWGT